MPVARSLPASLARIQSCQYRQHPRRAELVLVQQWTTFARTAGSTRSFLTLSLRRGTSAIAERPFHWQQQRGLGLLGTLKAVFKQPTPPNPPKRIPKETRILGRVRVDEYDWMSDKSDPDLRDYIHAENTYAHEYFASETAAVHLLNREMKQVLRTKKIAAPLTTVVRGFEYYTKTSRHGMIYCRRRKSPMAKEEVLLDSAFLPENCNVKKVLLSTSHHIFSFLILEEGEELGSLHFRNLDTGHSYEEVLEGVFNFVWGNDNKTVYYTKSTDVLRPYQVWAHRVGTPPEEDVLVFQDDDDSVFIDVGSTKDQRFVTINGNSLSSSEVRILDAGHDFSTGKFPELTVVAPRVEGVEYYVDHHDDHYYILTNDNPNKNFRVMRANRNHPDPESWVELMGAKDGEKIEDVDIFKNYMVIYAKRDALPVISCYHFETGVIHEVPLPEQFCTIAAGVNLDYETDSFQFTLNSPYAHEATYEYDMASRVMTALRVHPIHRLDRSKYTCTRIKVDAEDGETKIPVTLLHKKNIHLNGRNPTLMRAYGAYGVSTDIDFRVENFPLLERGWIIALAHVRGGSELGTLWYHQGKLENKRNTFTDFINVAEHLVKAGFTNPRKLTATGVSAGGLLMGAVFNMRPDLFRAMVLNVPFLDPMTTMLDPNIPLTKVEFLEWGNPAESREMYDYMRSYAPYDTIPEYEGQTQESKRSQQDGDLQSDQEQEAGETALFPPPPITPRRPALMISCGERDQRVDYSQSTKFVARLRSRLAPWYGSKGKEVCLLMIDENRGHFGNGFQDERVKNWAREVVFLLGHVYSEDDHPLTANGPRGL